MPIQWPFGLKARVNQIGGQTVAMAFLLSACGGDGSGGDTANTGTGSRNGGVPDGGTTNNDGSNGLGENVGAPPIAGVQTQGNSSNSFDQPVDLSRATDLAPKHSPDAYWADSLIGLTADQISQDAVQGGVIRYAFPQSMPDYLRRSDTLGWEPASQSLVQAYLDVFEKVETIFDIRFEETEDLREPNVIAIQSNRQDGSGAYAYFPSSSPLGYDIFHNIEYSNPTITHGSTNFDYEAVLHELGHTLGLKEPFASIGRQQVTLIDAEDNSFWTVMTYSFNPDAFDGFYRPFDLMALARTYGVNPNFESGRNTYNFSAEAGTFIIDGGGTDTISARGLTHDVTIDLRSETQSHVGKATDLISQPLQLTISQNTWIENATGGIGDDFLIGNDLDNVLVGGNGDDSLFGGEGADTLDAGLGDDILDLSEDSNAPDIVAFTSSIFANGRDLIAGFMQGSGGDALQHTLFQGLQFLAVKDATLVSELDISNTIVRLSDTAIDTAKDLSEALTEDGALSGLSMDAGSHAFAILAESPGRGETQQMFYLRGVNEDFDISLVAAFVGDDLDINNWTMDNFV